ncbi:hypothetical protein TELCIR_19842, partial [Teladorsagia circumcincta]
CEVTGDSFVSAEVRRMGVETAPMITMSVIAMIFFVVIFSLSSITNAMAFFIGMTSQTPAVRSFSLYSAIAISICFFYQLIMFCAVLAASGYRERSGRQSFLCWRKANPK